MLVIDFAKILIIEDDPMVLNALSGFLIQEFDVRTASSGQKGLEQIKTERPLVVLLDLLLPDLDGFEILKQVRSTPEIANTPIIILSNMSSMEHIKKAQELGATDYLIKEEVNFEIIRLKVKQALSIIKNY